MPRYDAYHNQVKTALVKDGWTITDDPLSLQFEDVNLFADLGAEKVLAAEKASRKIAVEIKVFGSKSHYSDLEKALGQYGIYRTFLKTLQPERELFLAITVDIYEDFFQRPSVRAVVADHRLKLLVFNEETEEITAWLT